MLAEMMEKFKVINSIGNRIGMIKDIYIDLNTWNIAGLEISPGVMKSNFILGPNDIIKFDEKDRTLIINDQFDEMEIFDTPHKKMYPFDELKKRNVLDVDGDRIGRIYNLEIPFEKLKGFKVWKILIRTGFMERRLRLPVSEISSVMDDIHLKGKVSEYIEEPD